MSRKLKPPPFRRWSIHSRWLNCASGSAYTEADVTRVLAMSTGESGVDVRFPHQTRRYGGSIEFELAALLRLEQAHVAPVFGKHVVDSFSSEPCVRFEGISCREQLEERHTDTLHRAEIVVTDLRPGQCDRLEKAIG